jgi:hypothetical protein
MTPPDVGSFPLTGVGAFPNVTVAFPGEHWSNRKAYEAITPGEAVMPLNSGGTLYVAVAGSADSGSRRIGIALRTVQVPDINSGPGALGPNEIMNTVIAQHEYVHVWLSGAFHLTLVTPAVYVPGDLIGWDPGGARPTGKTGTGSWKKVATEAGAFAEVMEFRPYNAAGTEGIVTVRSLRTQS